MTARGATPTKLFREIPASLGAVDAVCRELRGVLEAAGLGAVGFAVELMARESLNNAVIHGHGGGKAGQVTADLRLGPKWVCLRVTDAGPGFPWRNRRRELPDGRAVSGRGLALCQLHADKVEFNRRGNRITLWVRRTRQEESVVTLRD